MFKSLVAGLNTTNNKYTFVSVLTKDSTLKYLQISWML